MDNVHPPTLADIEVGGEERKVVFYGSKSGHQFVLDRTNGEPVLPVIEKPMITDSRQLHAATQPFPETRLLPDCVVWEKLDPENIPGDPWRAVPNYNGYQPDAEGNLVFNPDSYVAVDEPFLTYPDGYPSGHREGCMYDPQWDAPILSTTSQNGGADWSNHSYSHSTNLVYWPYGTNPVAHWNGAPANGLRAIGQYQTGGILAYDASTGEVAWRNHLGTDMSHGQGPLTTASDLLFVGQIDGRALAMDAATGDVLWEFQTGSGIAGAPVTYEIDGEQYVAVFAAGSTNPYGGSVTQGDSLWAFKLGGTLHDRVGKPGGAGHGAAVDPSSRGRRRRRGRDGRQHRPARPDEPDRRHGSRARQRVGERHAADASAGAGRHDGDVPQPRGRDVPELPEPEAALRDAVLRGRVQRQAAARRDLSAHVRPCR